MSDLPRVFEFHRACEKVNNNHLRPCPFCGGEPLVHREYDGSEWMECKNKSCIGSTIIGFMLMWNNRPLEDALQAKLDIAVEALKRISFYASSDWNHMLIAQEALKKLEK